MAQLNTSPSTQMPHLDNHRSSSKGKFEAPTADGMAGNFETPTTDGTAVDEEEEGEELDPEVIRRMNETRWEIVTKKLLAEAGVLQTGEYTIHDGWLEDDAADLPSESVRNTEPQKEFRSIGQTKHNGGSTIKLFILPNSKSRLVWNILCVIACLFDFVQVPVNIAFSDILDPGLALQWVVLIFWVADIVFNFLTGVYINGTLCMEPWKVAKVYIKTWFALDVMLVTIDSIMLLSPSALEGNQAGFSFIDLLQLLRIFRLLRMRKMSYVLTDFHIDHLEGPQACMSMTFTCMIYLAGIHVVSCLWHWIRRKLNEDNGWLLELEIAEDAYMLQYWSSVNEVHGFMLGSSGVALSTSWERAFEATFRFFGLLATAIFLAQAACAVRLLKDTKTSKIRKACHSYLQSHNVPQRLAMLLKRYVETDREYAWRKEIAVAEDALLRDIPKKLQTDLFWNTRYIDLSKESFIWEMGKKFTGVTPTICFEACSEMLVRDNEILMATGHRATDVLFLLTGTLKYSLPNSKASNSLMDAMNRVHILRKTHPICEPALWTKWFVKGKLISETECSLIQLNVSLLRESILRFPHLHRFAVSFARKYVSILNADATQCTDITRHCFECDDLDEYLEEETLPGHAIFLSHYKVEAGTEASLLHDDLSMRLKKRKCNGKAFKLPVFLDSELLQDLSLLQDHVLDSQNIVLLLTPGIFTRPWCVIELILAMRNDVDIVPVEIQKPGLKFEYPNESFYAKLRSQSILDGAACELLSSLGMDLADAEAAIKHTCTKIALTFSPHKNVLLRDSEISLILERCLGAGRLAPDRRMTKTWTA